MTDESINGSTTSFDLDLLTHASPTKSLPEKVKELFEEWSAPVYRYLLVAVGNVEEAEDITQEVFLRLYRHVHSGGAIASVRFWVFKVAHNLAINHNKQRKFLTPINHKSWSDIIESLPDKRLNPEAVLIEEEKFVQLHKTMARLTPQERQCLYLRAEGLKYREIAEVLNIAIPTVSEFVRRGIKKLTSPNG